MTQKYVIQYEFDSADALLEHIKGMPLSSKTLLNTDDLINLGKLSAAEDAASKPSVQTTPETPPTYAMQDVKDAFGEYIAVAGMGLAKNLLDAFGAPKASHVKPEQFAEFVAACRRGVP